MTNMNAHFRLLLHPWSHSPNQTICYHVGLDHQTQLDCIPQPGPADDCMLVVGVYALRVKS